MLLMASSSMDDETWMEIWAGDAVIAVLSTAMTERKQVVFILRVLWLIDDEFLFWSSMEDVDGGEKAGLGKMHGSYRILYMYTCGFDAQSRID